MGFDLHPKRMGIYFPSSSWDDVSRYHDSIVAILDKIKIDDKDQDLREHLTNVYECLGRLNKVISSNSCEKNKATNPLI